MTLNAVGAERDLYKLIADKDIFKAINMMENNDKEVDKAIAEYNPQTHEVMNRRNKYRKGEDPYITEKLPRTRQRYINEVELFFLLGKPVIWKKEEGEDDAYSLYVNYLKKIRFDSLLRKAKRLAGSETESALVFNLSRKKNAEGKVIIDVKPFVVARSLGYRLRPMFDQYGDLIALAYGYFLRQSGRNVLHYDILTAEYTFYCKKGKSGWEVETYENPTGKINAVYFKQPKAWDGVVPRIAREEMLDSKIGDTNNYFADPMASATADVIDNLADPDKPGRLIQLTGANSKFEYIDPPQNSDTRKDEMRSLHNSILFDSFTPDLSYESIKGLGSLSGAAMHNALIQGYIKRDGRKEIYGEMIDRVRSVIFEILKLQNPTMLGKLEKLIVSFEFSEPFDEDKTAQWKAIAELYGAGLVSLDTAVKMLALTPNPEEEADRIRMDAIELQSIPTTKEQEVTPQQARQMTLTTTQEPR